MVRFLLWLTQRAGGLSKELWALLLTTLIAANYAALYYAYYQFYVSFGLRPADVGLTRLRLLQESLIGVFLSPLTLIERFAVPIMFIAAGALAVRATYWLLRERRTKPLSARRSVLEAAATIFVAFVAVLVWLVIFAYIDLARYARDLGNSVRRDGHIVVSTVTRGLPTYRPVADFLAIPADLITKEDAPSAPVTAGCILYLGQTETHVVVFDVRKRLIVRSPVGEVVVVTHPALKEYPGERLPERCLPDVGNRVEP